MESDSSINYKKNPLAELFKFLKTDLEGLTDEEAVKRSKIYGLNEITKKKKLSPWLKFLIYFKNPLILVLLAAAIISGIAGEIRNTVIIIIMVFLSVILNFYQEHKSSQAAEQIAKKLAVRATVLRNRVKKDILTKYIVPGDIILLTAGDIVPADGRVIQADDFFVNESALTGESFPVEKTENGGESNNVIFSGTNVVSGYAQLLVIHTGGDTEYGKIADKLRAPNQVNAFEIGVTNFGIFIIKIIIAIVLIIFFIDAFYKRNVFDSLIFAIAIAVGITPELLPMILSVNMARGSIKMAKKGVIVKRLNSIPDFGSMDILCTDKTGTLTENKITLVKYLDIFGNESAAVLRLAYINGYFEAGIKSLLDKAILEFKDIKINNLKKIDEIPYDFIRKRSSIIFEEDGQRHISTKGAPEEIFKICANYFDGEKNNKITSEIIKKISDLYDSLSNDGFRVLAIATKDVTNGRKVYAKTEESEMTFRGFVAFYDPPKKSAKETLVFMKKHGIDIKIITGDGPLVTKKICEELDLKITGIISGDEFDMDKMSDQAIAIKAASANIFARFSPTQKAKIISSLRQSGFVVGYLGDGINDAPSLKNADVGISVENAVDVAKETADIILMNKSLKELMDGVLEGRKTFSNTMKYLMMGLSSNFGNMFSMIGAVIFLPFFPMLPGQILLNNFLYDFSQLSIPLDNVDKEYLKKPKHWDMKYIKKFMYIFGPISSIFDFLTFYFLYSIFHLNASMFQTGWFIESLATQTLVIYIIRTRKIPFLQSRPNKYLVFTTLSAILIGILIPFTFIGSYFGFTALPANVIGAIFILVLIYLIIVEIAKRIFYRVCAKCQF
jgi:Mg2+-importing ATPase